MSRNLLVVNGHPDPRPERFCAALCDAYEAGARKRGCATRRLDVGAIDIAALARAGDAIDGIEAAFRLLRAADRLAIIYPLWADAPPVGLMQVFDYVARLEEMLKITDRAAKKARVVVTTALPALVYRGKLGHIALNGIDADAPLFIGGVDTSSQVQRQRWLEQVWALGQAAN